MQSQQSTTSASRSPFDAGSDNAVERPVLAVDQLLFAFGRTRGARTSEETAHHMDTLARAVLLASNCALEEGEDPVQTMLKNRRCDPLACAALLRLLVFDDEVFSEDSRLLHSTAMFDRVVGPTLYGEVQLTPKVQSFDKRDRLRGLVESHEDRLIGHVGSLKSLEAFQSFRRIFNELFNNRATRAFVLPFLPSGATQQSFAEYFGLIQAVADAEEADIVDRADAVAEASRELRETAIALDTWYAQEIIVALSETAERIVQARIVEAGFADPAALSLSLRAKRYPFGKAGLPVTIRFDLTNAGPGRARDVVVRVEAEGISLTDASKPIGLMAPGSRILEFHGETAAPIASADGKQQHSLYATLAWQNADRTPAENELLVPLEAQAQAVDWGELAYAEPYELEPVTDDKHFAGREAAVRDVAKVILRGGSALIEGEKRVGKTSLAFAVRRVVEAQSGETIRFLPLEAGDFGANTPEATVARLGEKIAQQAKHSDSRLAGLSVPSFELGLTTLTDFFEETGRIAPDLRFCIVIDEFDSLSHPTLYQRSPIGEAFFQTLRSLGGKENLSFLIVGSGRMKWVLANHGQTLNKFRRIPLGYFDEDQVDGYAALVKAPVGDALSYSDASIDVLYRETAGNPYMSKLLLKELFDRHVERQDADVQVEDVEEALAYSLPKLGPAGFQHFWDDDIPVEVEDQEYVSITRRRVLVAFARCKQRRVSPTEEAIVAEARSLKVSEPEAVETLQKFRDRAILVSDEHGVHACRVQLFEAWLTKHSDEIVLGGAEDETLVHRQIAIERMRPKQAELDELAEGWRTYRGQDVRAERIATWLSQFGGGAEQRAVIPILKHLRFYSTATIGARFADLHDRVLRHLARSGYKYKLRDRQRNRSDLLVCGLDGGGSGASHLVRTYRHENGIYKTCAVDAPEVPGRIAESGSAIRAVLIVEDFIATGSTAAKGLEDLRAMWSPEQWGSEVDFYLLAVCGFEDGIAKAEAAAAKIGWDVSILAGDVLGEQDRCFSESSLIFDEEADRAEARALCARFGSELEPKHPLGYGDSQAAVCFEHGCPNNSLPVLWKEAPTWTPLFPRQ